MKNPVAKQPQQSGVHVGIASLLELPEINNAAVETDRPAELEKIRNFDCNCERQSKDNAERPPVFCSQQIDPDVIWHGWMTWMVNTTVVCRATFCFVYG